MARQHSPEFYQSVRVAGIAPSRPVFASDPALVTVWDTDDQTGLNLIPQSAAAFLGYDDGNPILDAIKLQRPHAKILTITTVAGDANFDALMCDCEASGFTPAQAAWWAHSKIVLNKGRPCIYVEVSQKPEVIAALAFYGLEFGRDVDCYLAWWNGVPMVPEGIFEGVGCGQGNVGIQYFNDGDLYDISVALASWVNPPPPVPPIPPEDEMDAIQIIAEGTYKDGAIFLNGGSAWIGPLDEDSVTELKANSFVKIFASKTNSIFHGKAVLPYPAQ